MKRSEQKELTRETIRRAALALFEEKGVEAATIAEITARAGVAKGTFFFHFESKEAVLFELQQLWVTEEIMRLMDRPDLPVIPTIKMMSEMVAVRVRYSHGMLRSIFQSCMTDGAVREKHQKLLKDTAELLGRWFEQAQQRGEITAEIPAGELAEQVVHTYFGTMFCWAMGDGQEELNEAIARAIRIILRGFRHP